MKAAGAAATRVVLFEVGGAAYAIPIAEVLEVTEAGAAAAIPSIPRTVAGVVNHHGDALPLVAREALFSAGPLAEPAHVLVIAPLGAETARLGLPVDRVLGLADLPLGARQGSGLVMERVPLEERIVGVLCAGRLVERAARAVEAASAAGAAPRATESMGDTP